MTRFERAYYSASIREFLDATPMQVLGAIAGSSEFAVDLTQRDAWRAEIDLLRSVLPGYVGRGKVYLEFVVPRLGKRIDAVLLIDHTVFVIEFKIGERSFARHDIDQVWDYALDLKNFHESSHSQRIAPILVVTGATGKKAIGGIDLHNDGVLRPTKPAARKLER